MLPLSSASSSASATSRLGAIEIEPGDRGAGELVGGVRLEILAADLPRDLERLADPALVVVEIAQPPADAGTRRECLVPILRLPVLEQDERLLDELARRAADRLRAGVRSRRAPSGRGPGAACRRPRSRPRRRAPSRPPAPGGRRCASRRARRGSAAAAWARSRPRVRAAAAQSGSPRGRACAGRPSPAPRRRALRAPAGWSRRAPRAASRPGRGGTRGSRRALRPPSRTATRVTCRWSSARAALASPEYATSRMRTCLKR